VPGGKAAYPSSVLMNAVPAKVAGVRELVMVSPNPNPLVLAAAALAGVDRVFGIGGAQAVAALAYGTKSIPRVDKIVGPGNAYVRRGEAPGVRRSRHRHARRPLGDPGHIRRPRRRPTGWRWIFSRKPSTMKTRRRFCFVRNPPFSTRFRFDRQASSANAEKGRDCKIPRGARRADPRARSRRSLRARRPHRARAPGAVGGESARVAAEARAAGAIFLGQWSSEAIGDYCAGPNHVLPTAGTARFSSPLGVYDFQKRTSVIGVSKDAARKLGASR
jgi:histidinol dehydrogenase